MRVNNRMPAVIRTAYWYSGLSTDSHSAPTPRTDPSPTFTLSHVHTFTRSHFHTFTLSHRLTTHHSPLTTHHPPPTTHHSRTLNSFGEPLCPTQKRNPTTALCPAKGALLRPATRPFSSPIAPKAARRPALPNSTTSRSD